MWSHSDSHWNRSQNDLIEGEINVESENTVYVTLAEQWEKGLRCIKSVGLDI